MHNAHVALHYRFLCWLAEKQGNPVAQWFFYTAAMREVCPGWRVDDGY